MIKNLKNVILVLNIKLIFINLVQFNSLPQILYSSISCHSCTSIKTNTKCDLFTQNKLLEAIYY